jgi:signal transduction histidine kinase/ligand-binding sensor domain-containing protein
VFHLRSPKTFFFLVLFSFLAFPQSEPGRPTSTEQPITTQSSSASSSDNATLNLHRWGAVTLFHGLPSDRVNAIAEDVGGAMWFATDNGLVRYDGRNVEAVPNEAALPSRRVLALRLDGRGALWIGTDAGAARLANGRIEPIAETRGHAVTAIATSPTGDVALVTAQGEILRFPASGAYEPREASSSGILSGVESRIRKGPEPPGVVKLDPATHPYQLKSPNRPNEILPLTAVAFTREGEWAVGSSGRGLLLHKDKDVREAVAKAPRPYFATSLYDDGQRLWIGDANGQAGGLWTWQNGQLAKTPLDAGAVTTVNGSELEVWAGTNRQGAFLLNFEIAGFRVYEHLTFENTAGGLRSNHINVIFRDREGVVWFGTDRGVCRYDRTSFRNAQVSSRGQGNFIRTLLHSKRAGTWAGSNSGLFQLAGRTRETNYDSWIEIAELQGRSIYALAEDAAGAVWAGTSGGLFVKPNAASNFSRIASAPKTVVTIEEPNAADPAPPPEIPPDPQATADDPQAEQPDVRESVRALAVFRGHVYAAFFERGLERLDGDRRVPVLGEAFARQAVCLASEGDAALWIGTAGGELWRFDGAKAQSIPVPKKPSDENAIHALALESGRLWIGTAQGLYLREGDAIREIQSGLNVQAIFPQGGAPEPTPGPTIGPTIWIATQNSGLHKLRPGDGTSTRFDTEQGLASQQVFALSSSIENDLLIGTNRGVTRHRPNPLAPRIAVRRLVADRIYLPDELLAERPLDHPQRYFLLEVAGLGSRTFPSQFQYEFTLTKKIEGQMAKVTKRDPNFAIGDLTPGPYTISVRAISRDLIYSEPLTVRLRVRGAPFPWGTLLLASLLAVAVAAAVWAFRQQRRLARANVALEQTNAELHETRLRLANETEAERSRIARDLHDQTLADLRHLLVLTDQLPASSVSAATGKGNEDAPSPAVLRREIESISSEIRHICEDLSPSVLENIGFLPALEWALADAVAHLPADEKFAYEFNCDPELEGRLRLQPIEQIQLYRIVQEALNNISRHARARDVKLSVGIESDADLAIEIRDDGVGFDGARSNKTGHGIANIRSRANLIGAQVEWHAEQPGCRFVVRKHQSVAR